MIQLYEYKCSVNFFLAEGLVLLSVFIINHLGYSCKIIHRLFINQTEIENVKTQFRYS